MIKVIEGNELSRYPRLANAMFAARAEVFGERLGWDVKVESGWEKDRYDGPDTVYLISVDGRSGEARGSLRLIPTTTPNMLKDVFGPRYLDGLVVESALIWECTRFCVHPSWTAKGASPAGVSAVTVEMLMEICEVGLQAGLEFIVGVFDRSMKPIYRRGGWSPEIIGQSGDDPRTALYCGLWEVSEESLKAMRQRSGVHESVLEERVPVTAAKTA